MIRTALTSDYVFTPSFGWIATAVMIRTSLSVGDFRTAQDYAALASAWPDSRLGIVATGNHRRRSSGGMNSAVVWNARVWSGAGASR